MTISYYPFDAGAGDETYEAEWSQMLRFMIANGVLPRRDDELEPYGDSTGMQIKVKSGFGTVLGHFYHNDSEEILAIAAADGSNPRIDVLALQVDWPSNDMELIIVTGTPGATPAIPALTQSASIWQVPLAWVAVGTGVSTITAGNVTDVRNKVGQTYIEPGGRLTAESGVPASPADQTAKDTLFYASFKNNMMPLYDANLGWREYQYQTEPELDLAGYTALASYDIFGYLNGGVPALESLIWTDPNTRATALSWDSGRRVKSGDPSRLYLGSININSSGGEVEDTELFRGIWNNYNKVPRILRVSPSGTWSFNSATFRQINATAAYKAEIMIGISELPVEFRNSIAALTHTGEGVQLGIGIDSTTVSTGSVGYAGGFANAYPQVESVYKGLPGIGYHTIVPLELSAGTINMYPDLGSYVHGHVMA